MPRNLLAISTLLAAASALPANDLSVVAPHRPGLLEDRLPASILHLESEAPRHVLLVEKEPQLLHLLSYLPGEGDEGPRVELLTTYPCTTGQNTGDKAVVGDKKTPEGAYFFTEYIDDSVLLSRYGDYAKIYGPGAFPMDYPNLFDRRDGRRGGGIWLHGVETNDRVEKARDTRGCVAVSNDDFRELRELIEIRRTPIVVTRRARWLNRETHQMQRQEVLDSLEGWLEAWQAKDIDAFIEHYDPEFHSRGMDREAWREYKDRFNRIYEFIRVGTDDLALVRESDDRVIADFRQTYVSDQYADEGQKRLYLRRAVDGWKILGEDWRAFRIVRGAGLEPFGDPNLEPELPPMQADAQEEIASGPVSEEETPPEEATIEVAAAPASPASPVEARATEEDTDEAEPTPTLHLRDVVVSREEQGARISFVLENQGPEPAAGYLTLAALDRAGRSVGRYPSFARIRAGEPLDFRRGEWFFVQSGRHVEALVPLGGSAEKIVLFAHGRRGELLLHEEVGL